MAVTAHLYDNAIANAFGSTTGANAPNIDILSDTIACALTFGYTPNQGTDAFWSTPVANELANGSGYTTNGITLANKTFAIAGHVLTFDNTVDPAWTASTLSATDAVFVDRTPGTDATRPLIGYIDFGATVSSVSGTFTITLSASGIFTVTMA